MATKNGADEDRVWSAKEIAGTQYIAFQGGVYDLEDFAVGHPGGADLVSTTTFVFLHS